MPYRSNGEIPPGKRIAVPGGAGAKIVGGASTWVFTEGTMRYVSCSGKFALRAYL
jgi:hypothetical protein